MTNKVVARYRDGRVLKGTGLDIDPARPFFHLQQHAGGRVQVTLTDLKALFFVRSLDGDPAHNEDHTPDPADPRARGLTLVRIVFEDGEVVVGLTIRYPPTRTYFYVLPVDTASNNVRILVNTAAIVSMEAQLEPPSA
jgi:hypothetical protein